MGPWLGLLNAYVTAILQFVKYHVALRVKYVHSQGRWNQSVWSGHGLIIFFGSKSHN